jgi:phosphohistidine swiveling domain-containing protein
MAITPTIDDTASLGQVPGPRSFEPPGPGTWTLDASHVPQPMSGFILEALPEPFTRGFAESFARYGLLLDVLDVAFVGGFMYNQLRVVGAPPDAVGHPPREVWDSVLSGLPPIRERLDTADRALAGKLWRDDLARWDAELKPALAAQRGALRAVDPRALDDTELADYVDACRAALVNGIYHHHRHNAAAMIPIGLFLATALPLTGRSPGDLLGLLQGASPVTQGFPTELAVLRRALDSDPAAAELLDGTDPVTVLAALRARPGRVGDAAATYLDLIGEISVDGEDSVGSPGGAEAPDLMLVRLHDALVGELLPPAGPQAAEAEIRAVVPRERLADFDEALAEARLVYRLRDERAVYGDKLAGALCRRALLEVGRRLLERGVVAEPENAVDASADEVRALLLSDPAAPDRAELEARTEWRRTASYRDMPPLFGPTPGPPLPAEWLPPAAALIQVAMGMTIGAILHQPEAATTSTTVRGLPVSPGVHEGRAVLVRDVADLQRIVQGDVVVATSTGPAFNLVLPLVGAIVTDRGGLLSHAAIVAREFGIPAVVGCSDATLLLHDGDRVQVDGVTGVVTRL